MSWSCLSRVVLLAGEMGAKKRMTDVQFESHSGRASLAGAGSTGKSKEHGFQASLGFGFQLHHPLSFLCLTFLICKMRVIIFTLHCY